MNNLAMKEDPRGNDASDRLANMVLTALGRKLAGQQGPKKPPTVNRQAALQELMRKEAILQKHLATPSGLKKIAACRNVGRVKPGYIGKYPTSGNSEGRLIERSEPVETVRRDLKTGMIQSELSGNVENLAEMTRFLPGREEITEKNMANPKLDWGSKTGLYRGNSLEDNPEERPQVSCGIRRDCTPGSERSDMIQSVLHGDVQRLAEMSSPLPAREEVTDEVRVRLDYAGIGRRFVINFNGHVTRLFAGTARVSHHTQKLGNNWMGGANPQERLVA